MIKCHTKSMLLGWLFCKVPQSELFKCCCHGNKYFIKFPWLCHECNFIKTILLCVKKPYTKLPHSERNFVALGERKSTFCWLRISCNFGDHPNFHISITQDPTEIMGDHMQQEGSSEHKDTEHEMETQQNQSLAE